MIARPIQNSMSWKKNSYVRCLELEDDMQRDMKELGQAFKLDGSKKFEECQGVAL